MYGKGRLYRRARYRSRRAQLSRPIVSRRDELRILAFALAPGSALTQKAERSLVFNAAPNGRIVLLARRPRRRGNPVGVSGHSLRLKAVDPRSSLISPVHVVFQPAGEWVLSCSDHRLAGACLTASKLGDSSASFLSRWWIHRPGDRAPVTPWCRRSRSVGAEGSGDNNTKASPSPSK